MGRIWSILLVSMALSSAAMAKQVETSHRGMDLVGTPLPDQAFDVSLRPVAPTLQTIKASLDEVYAASPFAASKIDKLKQEGRIQIIYDASFPKRSLTNVTIAAFFPDFFKKGTEKKDFVVVVGRYGAKWEPKELAAVMVHELVGHGLQHLRGHTKFMRNIDLECEAYLYQEQYYQAAKFDRATRDQVAFRDALTDKWCSDFRRYVRKTHPDKVTLWGPGPMQVPALLKLFPSYTQHLVESGVAQRAIDKSTAERTERFEDLKAEAEQNSDPEKLFQVGMRYFRGLGVKVNKREGLTWIFRAAKSGHPRAQGIMGRLFEKGGFKGKDPVEAYKWYALALAQGFDQVKKDFDRLKATLTPEQIEDAKSRIAGFVPRSG